MNAVIRELSLDLAEGKYEVDFFEHVPGVANTLPDFLSRLAQPGASQAYPAELRSVTETHIDRRSAGWWETAGTPEAGEEGPAPSA